MTLTLLMPDADAAAAAKPAVVRSALLVPPPTTTQPVFWKAVLLMGHGPVPQDGVHRGALFLEPRREGALRPAASVAPDVGLGNRAGLVDLRPDGRSGWPGGGTPWWNYLRYRYYATNNNARTMLVALLVL